MTDSASRTAVLVCQGRAAAHGRIAVGRFSDPVAMALLDDDEREPVEQVRSGVPPAERGARMQYEFVHRCASVMAPRTIAIDDAIREHPSGQVVVLGAGLDGRAWRMPELSGSTVFEVDHPATQAAKRERLASRPPTAGAVRFVAVDFTCDDLDTELRRSGHDSDAPTTWVWEGVVSYLTAEQVAATLAVLQAHTATGSRLIVNYQAPSLRAGVGRRIGRLAMRATGAQDVWADEPHRSRRTPQRIAARLRESGFTTTRDHDLAQIWSAALSEPLPDGATSLTHGRVLVAER